MSKEYYKSLATKHIENKGDCDLNSFEYAFHHAMQNPQNGEVVFDKISRVLLNNGNLCSLRNYFSENGDHIFGQTINTLRITNVILKGYNNWSTGGDQMPDGTGYICDLISNDPKITHIDLSNTQLGDEEASMLIQALNTNFRLQKLDLTGNSISPEKLTLIEAKLSENRNQYQAKLIAHTFFKTTPVVPEAVADIIKGYITNA